MLGPEAKKEPQRIYGDHKGLTLCGTKEQALREPVGFDGRNQLHV